MLNIDRVVDEINQQSSYTKRQVDVLIEYTVSIQTFKYPLYNNKTRLCPYPTIGPRSTGSKARQVPGEVPRSHTEVSHGTSSYVDHQGASLLGN